MPSAVRSARNRHFRRIEIAIGVVDDAADHAAKVGNLQVQVRQVDLTPRLPEASGRIPQHSVTVLEQLRGNIPRTALTAGITVNQGDQRKRTCARRHLQARIEESLVCVAEEKAVVGRGSSGWRTGEKVFGGARVRRIAAPIGIRSEWIL